MTSQICVSSPWGLRFGVPSPVHMGPALGSGQGGPCPIRGLGEGLGHARCLWASLVLAPGLAPGACCLSEWRWGLPRGLGVWAAGHPVWRPLPLKSCPSRELATGVSFCPFLGPSIRPSVVSRTGPSAQDSQGFCLHQPGRLTGEAWHLKSSCRAHS